MKILVGTIFYYAIFIAFINIINLSLADSFSSEKQMNLINKNYELLYKKMMSRRITKLDDKNNALWKILKKFGYENININIYDSPLDNPSALCYPDKNHIFISIELLARVNTEDEMAFIVGHELSHIINNHNYSKKEKQAFFKGVKALGSSVNTDTVISLEEEIFLLEQRHNKELAADRSALNFIQNGHYSSSGSITILRKLGSALDEGTDTHPSIVERISKIKNIAAYKNNRKALTSNNVFRKNVNLINYSRTGDEIDKEAIRRALKEMDNYYKNL